MAENVTIKINVTADTAAIERVRAQLKSLCSETDDCTKTQEKHSKALDDVSNTQRTLAKDIDSTTKTLEKHSGATKKGEKSWGDFFKKLGNGKKYLAEALEGFEKLIKFGIKYIAIEAAAATAALALMSVAMKVGNFLAKGYQAALGGVSFALAAVIAGFSVFLAAQRQFQAVQFAPQYADGATNTTDKVKAASSAMKMFVDDTSMAVIGSKALSGAFKTLSDQAPVTGKTTAVFRSLSDYTTGIGGDLQKNSQELATFLALFQKKKTLGAVTHEGAKLGPDFKKILAEAGKLGIKTYDEFADAAMKGQLGKTFDKYKGSLNLLNSTLMGQLKQGVAKLKTMFNEMGEPLLGPVTKAIQKVMHVFEVMALRIRANVQNFGAETVLDKLVKVFEKIGTVVGDLLTNRLGKSTGVLTNLKNAWESLKHFFERVADYMRPLQEAGKALFDTLHPIVDAIFGNFSSTIQDINRLILENKSIVLAVGDSIGNFIRSWSGLGKVLRQAFMDSLPFLKSGLDILTKIVGLIGKVMSGVNFFITRLTGSKALGGLGTIIAGAIALKGLKFGTEMINTKGNSVIKNSTGNILNNATGGRINGQTIAQNMTAQTVNINAGSVMVNGAMTGTSPLTGMASGMNPEGGVGAGAYGPAVPGVPAAGVSRFAKYAPMMTGMGMMLGGQLLSNYGGRASYLGSYGRQAASIGGTAIQIAGAGNMMGLGGRAVMSNSTGVLGKAGTLMPALAGGYAGYKVGGAVSSALFGNDNSAGSRVAGAAVGVGSGAAAGAITGAAIGSLFGGVGAGPGAAAGAIFGAIAGGVSGLFGAGKHIRDAEKAAKKFVKTYSSAVDEAFQNGDIDALKNLQANFQKDAMDAAKGNQDAYVAELAKHKDEIGAIDKKIGTYSKNASLFSTYLGMGTDEMVKSGDKLKTNFQDSAVSIMNAAKTLGVNLLDNVIPAMNDFNGKLLDARLAMYDQQLSTIEAQKALDAAQDKILSGDTTRESIIGFLKNNFMYALSKTGGDVLQAESLANANLQTMIGPGGSMQAVGSQLMDIASEIGVSNENTQKLADQVVETGKLQFQATLLSNATGGKLSEGGASALLYQNLLKNGATGGANSDSLMKLMLSGKINPNDYVKGLIGGTAEQNAILTPAVNNLQYQSDMGRLNANRTDSNGNSGPGRTVSSNAGSVVSPNNSQTNSNVNNVVTNVNISGLNTTDSSYIKILAAEIAKVGAVNAERIGLPIPGKIRGSEGKP